MISSWGTLHRKCYLLLYFLFASSSCFSSLSMNNTRRSFLSNAATTALKMSDKRVDNTIRIGFTGDVMIGRGIDAILPHSVDGRIYESYMKHASGYVDIAVRVNGPLPQEELREHGCAYIWGDLLHELKEMPDCLIVNLETSLTTSEDRANKGINYRAHPLNVETLTIAGVDVATLANNHVLDWGENGLKETLATLKRASILTAGAGLTEVDVTRPVVSKVKVRTPTGTSEDVDVKVLAVGFPSAGVPDSWSAGRNRGGVYVERDANEEAARRILLNLQKVGPPLSPPSTITEAVPTFPFLRPSLSIVSLHWGPNWGWGTPTKWRAFAHTLIDGGADIVVGHSSHHVKGIEVYKGKLIAYGLGDFLNDYEGIVGQGYESFRDDLSCLYLPTFNVQSGELVDFEIIPCKIKHLRVQRATDPRDVEWLRNTLSVEGSSLGTSCELCEDESGKTNLRLTWKRH